ncbi:SRPBCC family protein [Lentzea sp. BCCO 10_0856]|uniref:SRPBCC family protein n=1 Tax=Lentzea miocenica TaxID=3095431 RepID=A0ABU4SSN7_9PSEU|nr:SRPBCC family protein [Lentzea sp. BCCO 10_0856]MDX8028873.1 SRPBCC family protein [Lentzea sp. BCCO 10_0856]
MSVDVRPEVVVRRPRAEVAAYMFDPAHDLAWTGGITASRPDQTGLLVQGATVVRTAKFLGRTFDYGYVVTAHEPDRLIEMKVEKPFPMTVRYELEDVPGGTNVAIRATGSPGGFFAVAEPLMRWQVRRSIRADLGRLKRNVEAAH